jgi:hypothetical protein
LLLLLSKVGGLQRVRFPSCAARIVEEETGWTSCTPFAEVEIGVQTAKELERWQEKYKKRELECMNSAKAEAN